MIVVGAANLGPLPMGNELSRLATRFFGDEAGLAAAADAAGRPIDAEEAVELGLVTFAPDDIDWDDEIRLAAERLRPGRCAAPVRHRAEFDRKRV
jgi:benzoyl-CoA-dihydrodiol lyase